MKKERGKIKEALEISKEQLLVLKRKFEKENSEKEDDRKKGAWPS